MRELPEAEHTVAQEDDGLRITPRHIVGGWRLVRGLFSLKSVPMAGALLD